MLRQSELVDLVKSYLPDVDEGQLNRAYVYAMKAHGGQRRASGDPYFSHPVEVAGILAGMRLDVASITTGLLHDIIEDTEHSYDDVKAVFGPETADLVEGVSKLSRIEVPLSLSVSTTSTLDQKESNRRRAENFRKFVLAMSDDIRVLLVKLADRLHNMRTLHYVPSIEKRRRIALETSEIYAPLAQRIGMNALCEELDEIAFGELDSQAHDQIVHQLETLQSADPNFIQDRMRDITKLLRAKKIKCRIIGRVKKPYSIWSKMRSRPFSLHKMADIVAFRIIVETIDDCYRALGIIHRGYSIIPSRFKDFISTPKLNGYRSLHTGVMGPGDCPLEIQIRTARMERVAEMGVAAHWCYKQNISGHEGRQYRWLRELLDIVKHASSPEEFLDHTRMQMFRDAVFCFTPKGDIITLPKMATGLDFAYAVHTEVGKRCAAVKINGNIVSMVTPLSNGDRVEIMCARDPLIPPHWEQLVHTGKAQAGIRRLIRLRQRQEFINLGRSILRSLYQAQRGKSFQDSMISEAILQQYHAENLDDLYYALGSGACQPREVLKELLPSLFRIGLAKIVPSKRVKQSLALKNYTSGITIHYAACCHPMAGDAIVGVISKGRGMRVHTKDCESLKGTARDKIFDLHWDQDDSKTTVAATLSGRLHIILANQAGALARLSDAISRNNSNITNLKIVRRSKEFFEMVVDLEIHDLGHLSHIMAALRASKQISSVERVN